MRLDEKSKRPGVQPDRSKQANQARGVYVDAEKVKIPLKIDDGIVVRSLTNSTHTARSRIIGAMHGEFILITEPTVPISKRYSAVIDENILCSYFNDGFLYNFSSRYLSKLMENIVCIEYPKEVEIRKIRKYRRVRVNIETKIVVRDNPGLLIADMTDISPGGCCLVLNQPTLVPVGTIVFMTFNLPNEAFVNEMQATAVRVNRIRNSEAAEVGFTFAGPSSEISKVVNFCDFCMFFEVG